MSDRGRYDSDPEPTEVFPPLRDDPPGTPPLGLPPLGADRDPDPTRVMPPTVGGGVTGGVPTGAAPAAGGPYEPGPPYGGAGGGGGGGGGGDEPPLVPEPDPWYRQPGPLAALIAGVAAVVVGIIALIVWTGDDDGGISGDTLPSIASTTTTSSVPDTTTTTTTTVPETTTTTTSTTTTTTTTTVPPTTVPPTTAAPTTQPPPPTTAAPTTAPPPAGQAMLDAIRADADLSTFADALACTGLDEDVLNGDALTVLGPVNDAFADLGDPCADPDAMEPILLLHLVSVDLTYQQIFAASELQTLGELVPVSPNTQTIGTNQSRIVERDVRAGGAILHSLDKVIVP